MLKTIVIIPARGESKRLPNKNILKFQGKPLIAHSIEYAKKQDFVEDVYISTDSALIKQVAIQCGAKVIDRPKVLSGDLEPTVTALKHVLESIEDEIENVILLQATNPLRPKYLLKEAFKIFNKNKLESLFTVSRNYHKLGKIKNNVFEPFNYNIGQRSQDLEPLFYENGLLYITNAKLIKQDVIISKDAYPLEVNHPFGSVDIDEQSDFDYANYIYNAYSED